MNDAGHDGRAVQEQILNLPPSNIVRNDFSHLGLLPPTQQDLDDAVSVISATASATIPYVQVNNQPAVLPSVCKLGLPHQKLNFLF